MPQLPQRRSLQRSERTIGPTGSPLASDPNHCEGVSNACAREAQSTSDILFAHAGTERDGQPAGLILNPSEITHMDPDTLHRKINHDGKVYAPVAVGMYVPGGDGHFIALLRLFDEETNGWSPQWRVYNDHRTDTVIEAVPQGMLIVSAVFLNEAVIRADGRPVIPMPARGVRNFALAGDNSCYANAALMQISYVLKFVRPRVPGGATNCIAFAESNADAVDRDLNVEARLPHLLHNLGHNIALTNADLLALRNLRIAYGNSGDAIGSMVEFMGSILEYLRRYAGHAFEAMKTQTFAHGVRGEPRPETVLSVQLQRATSVVATTTADRLQQQRAALVASVSHFLFWCWCARCVRSRSPMRALCCFVNCRRRRLCGATVPVPHLPVLLVSLLLMGKSVLPPWYGLLFGFCVHFPFANVPHACSVRMWAAGRFECTQRWSW